MSRYISKSVNAAVGGGVTTPFFSFEDYEESISNEEIDLQCEALRIELMTKQNPLALAISEEGYVASMEGVGDVIKKIIEWIKNLFKRIKEFFFSSEKVTNSKIKNINEKLDGISELEKALTKTGVTPTQENPVEVRLNGKVLKVIRPVGKSFHIGKPYHWMFKYGDKITSRDFIYKLATLKQIIVNLEKEFISNIDKILITMNEMVRKQSWGYVSGREISHPDKLDANVKSLRNVIQITNLEDTQWLDYTDIPGKGHTTFSLVPSLTTRESASRTPPIIISDMLGFVTDAKRFINSIQRNEGIHSDYISKVEKEVEKMGSAFSRSGSLGIGSTGVEAPQVFKNYSYILNKQVSSLMNLSNGYMKIISLTDYILNEIYKPI